MTSWTRPTAEEISRITHLTAKPEEQRYFFSRLENPLWIDALRDAGSLEPPSPTSTDGGERHAPWPVAGYIARVAGSHPDPEIVAQVLRELAETSNVFVQRIS